MKPRRKSCKSTNKNLDSYPSTEDKCQSLEGETVNPSPLGVTLPNMPQEADPSNPLYTTVLQMFTCLQALRSSYTKLYEEHQQTRAALSDLEKYFCTTTRDQIKLIVEVEEKVSKIDDGTYQNRYDNIRIEGMLNTIDKKMHNLQSHVDSIASRQKAAATPKQAAANTATEASKEQQSFFIGGLLHLRKWRQDHRSDPVKLVSDLLKSLNLHYFTERISVADNLARSSGNRMGARAAIVTMQSAQHKKTAIVKIKKYLANQQQQATPKVGGITVGDCFPKEELGKVRALGRIAAAKKKEDHSCRARVVNISGQAILQISQAGGPYEDYQPTEEELEGSYENRRHGMSLSNTPTSNANCGLQWQEQQDK